MSHVIADRVLDTSSTTGTGAFTVANAPPTGFETLNTILSASDTFDYLIQHRSANEWEVGIGTYSGSHVFARTTVQQSSNSDSAVNFSAGTKDVMIVNSAYRIKNPRFATMQVGDSVPFSDSSGTLTLQNVDALDGTTETTIENAIDALPNVTSLQGVPLTIGAYAATLLNNANEADFKAAVNLEVGTDVQAYSANLAEWSGVNPSADAATLVAAANFAAMRTSLGLEYADEVIGTVRNVGGAVGDGATDDRSAFVTADAAGNMVVPAGNYRIGSSITISTPAEFIGGKITIDGGAVVTFTKPIKAAPYQIFAGAGTVVFTRSQDAHPEWWGAIADNSTACRAAIQAADTALPFGSRIILSQGSYRVDTTTITLVNASLEGVGRQSILRPTASASSAVITVAYPRINLRNFSIFGDHLTTPVNTAIQLGTSAVEVGTAVVEDIWIYGFNGSNGKGIRCYRGNAYHFHRIRIQQCDYGVHRGGAIDSATITVTIASPGVVTWTGHTLSNGDIVVFTSTGALPTGITAGTNYFVVNAATDTFQISATSGGAAINTSGSQSGTHTGKSGKYWGDCHWDDCVIQATSVGVLDDNGTNAQYQRDMSILGCNVGYQAYSSVAESGVWIRPANIWFWHSNISANTAAGVYLVTGYLFEFGDTDINGTLSGPNVLIDGSAYSGVASNIEGIAFYDGSISGSQGHGVSLVSGRNVRFVGVKIVANSGASVNTYDGIIVGAAWEGLFEVTGCLIGVSASGESGWGNAYQFQRYGIALDAAACTDQAASGSILAAIGRVVITGNMLAGNATGGISGTGAPTGVFSRIYGNVGVTSQTEVATTNFSTALLAGVSSAAVATVTGAGSAITPILQVHGTGGAGSSASLNRWSNAAGGPMLILSKSRGTSAGSFTVVQSGDTLGEIVFAGADGTDMEPGAAIRAEVNATPGAGDMPAKIVFSTTADGAEAVTDRVTIDSTGISGIGAITSTSATAGVGYATGAGGTVTQATSRTTGVTLNKICGAITLVSAAGSTTPATFTVTNSAVAATDTVRVVQKSGTDLYVILVTAVGAGSFNITFYTTGGTTTEQPVFNFAVIKAVTS